ncbi:MAG: hypothetical protein JW715_05100 [Sedimentisphaerales bacterium]|nr:hypothetical protein [Sedimentisphaerales bacterium]
MGPEKCPFCGQEIDTEAAKCFFCGVQLNEEAIEKRLEQLRIEDVKKSFHKTRCPFTLQVIAVILICISILSSSSTKNSKMGKAKPSEESTVRLNTKVTFTGTQFIIYNNDTFDWTNVELQIILEPYGRNYSIEIPRMPAGKEQRIRATEFVRQDETRFDPYKMKPKRFRIWCDTPTGEKGSYFAGWDKTE